MHTLKCVNVANNILTGLGGQVKGGVAFVVRLVDVQVGQLDEEPGDGRVARQRGVQQTRLRLQKPHQQLD